MFQNRFPLGKKRLLIINNYRLVKNSHDQDLIKKVEELIDHEKDGYPTFQWPTEFTMITQAFGLNPQWYSKSGVPAHEGLDIKAPQGSKIFAVWDGEVIRVDKIKQHVAYGWHVRLLHFINGIKYETAYAHFEKPSHLEIGERVSKGDVVGYSGSTGNSTGPHLHLMLKQFNGELPDTEAQKKYEWPYNIIDPTPFFAELR